jgi:seryl-tRNA synthetase
LTGHKLENGEFRYTKEIIENTKNHRIDIIKSCNADYRELDTLLSDILKHIQMVVGDMIPKIYDELDIVKQKQEMMKE